MDGCGHGTTCLYYPITSLHGPTKTRKTLAKIISILTATRMEHYAKSVTAY